jgi:hypothetical protein
MYTELSAIAQVGDTEALLQNIQQWLAHRNYGGDKLFSLFEQQHDDQREIHSRARFP